MTVYDLFMGMTKNYKGNVYLNVFSKKANMTVVPWTHADSKVLEFHTDYEKVKGKKNRDMLIYMTIK